MKRQTKVDKLLAVLRDGKWHSADDLTFFVGHRFGDAIFKARRSGYFVEMRTIAHNKCQYRLLGHILSTR